jgi:putative transcriptional regulator
LNASVVRRLYATLDDYHKHHSSLVNTFCRFYATYGASNVIRFKVKELLAEKEFQEARVITLAEIAKETAIHRATLSKIANERGYNTGTDNVDRLCAYFECDIQDLLQRIPD